jgi:hypothetical protein
MCDSLVIVSTTSAAALLCDRWVLQSPYDNFLGNCHGRSWIIGCRSPRSSFQIRIACWGAGTPVAAPVLEFPCGAEGSCRAAIARGDGTPEFVSTVRDASASLQAVRVFVASVAAWILGILIAKQFLVGIPTTFLFVSYFRFVSLSLATLFPEALGRPSASAAHFFQEDLCVWSRLCSCFARRFC